MQDLAQLIDHIKYGTPYHGDVKQDIIDALEDYATNKSTIESAPALVKDSIACLPGEDFLSEITHSMNFISQNSKKYNKGELVERITEWASELTEMEGAYANDLEYVHDSIKNIFK